jgi:hypothetical protein
MSRELWDWVKFFMDDLPKTPRNTSKPPVIVAIGKPTVVKARECPTCKSKLDGSTGIEVNGLNPPTTLEEGDVSLCAYCGELLLFENDQHKLVTEDIVKELQTDPAEWRVFASLIKKHRQPNKFNAHLNLQKYGTPWDERSL